MDYTEKPDYGAVVDICTKTSLQELTTPGLLAVLSRDGTSGQGSLALIGLAAGADGQSQAIFREAVGQGETSDASVTAGYAITWRKADSFTGMVVKQDPGQGLIWLAYGSLIGGLLLVFYFPRRRVWARVSDGRVEIALVADRYVDASREFATLLADIGARTGRHPEQREAQPLTG